jgi:hypothetical protein
LRSRDIERLAQQSGTGSRLSRNRCGSKKRGPGIWSDAPVDVERTPVGAAESRLKQFNGAHGLRSEVAVHVDRTAAQIIQSLLDGKYRGLLTGASRDDTSGKLWNHSRG